MLVKLNIRAIALMVFILSAQHSMCISFNVSFFVALEFNISVYLCVRMHLHISVLWKLGLIIKPSL